MKSRSAWSLAAMTLLLASPAWALTEKTEHRDFNNDGHQDRLTTLRDRGSGYGITRRCIRDGLTMREACFEWTTSAYGLFEGLHETLPAKPMSPGLLAVLKRPACAAADQADPKQGVLWATAMPQLLGDNISLKPSPPTVRGKPQAGAAVCLSHAEAQRFQGAFVWDAQGNAKRAAPVPGRSILFPATKAAQLVLRSGRWQVYELLGAVALYDSTTDQHHWIASFADGGDEGFKIDRWQRLTDFNRTKQGFRFRVKRASGRSIVDVTLPQP